MSTLESTPRMKFAMITILILWGLGAYMVTGDLCSVPKKNQEWLQEHPEYFIGKKEYPDPDRVWEWNIGNGFISNIENIVMWLCLFFGFFKVFGFMEIDT